MKPPQWLLERTVLHVHELLLAEHGGPGGVRDTVLLESSLNRPRNKFSYEPTSSLFDLAAAYAFTIARNHPFVDGKKRTAFVCAVLFLEVNGHTLEAAEADAVVIMEALAAGKLEEQGLAAWLHTNSEEK